MDTTKLIYFYLTCLLIFISGCTNNSLPAPIAKVPIGIDPDSIYVSRPQPAPPGPNENGPSGAGIYGTYREQLEGLYSSNYIKFGSSYIGQLKITHYSNFEQTYAVICLVNYLQRPCNPEAPMAQLLPTDPVSIVDIPIKLDDLPEGMHDLEAIVASVPRYEGKHGLPNSFFEAYNMPAMQNVYVGSSAKPPKIEVIPPKAKSVVSGLGDFVFVVNQLTTLPSNGVPVWTQEIVEADTELSFYIHFHEVGYGLSRTNALSLFLDYQQIPLVVDNEEHMPLYIKRRPGTWQTVEAQIKVPKEPGSYVLLFVHRTHAHTPLDDSGIAFFFDEAYTTVQAVELVVEP